MSISPRRAGAIKRSIRAGISSSQTVSTDFLSTLNDMLEDERTPPPFEEVLDTSERQMIQKMLKAVDEREAQVLRLRYGLNTDRPHTLKEIGKILGLTRERVRQIETHALMKLNAIMSHPGASLI
jgi:RNA polymerase primary sigma factor